MKVIVNLPTTEDGKKLLGSKIAEFRAFLLVEKIKSLKVSDASKKKILNSVLEHIIEKETRTRIGQTK